MGQIGALAMTLAAACGFHKSAPVGVDGEVPPIDASPDATAFGTGPFGAPVLVAVSSPTHRDDDVTLTGDLLEMFFESDRLNQGDGDIYTARRASVTDAWSAPVRVDELSTTAAETSMEISLDGLTMYFSSNRDPAINNTIDVFVTTRPDRMSPWTAPVHVQELSTTFGDYNAQPWSDTVMYLGSDRPPARGNSDVFRSTRATAADPWGTPAVVPGLDTLIYEGEAHADAKGAVWFTGPGLGGDDDLWVSRPNVGGTYAAPERVTELASTDDDNDAWLSPDGRTIFFTSSRGGSLDIYMATR